MALDERGIVWNSEDARVIVHLYGGQVGSGWEIVVRGSQKRLVSVGVGGLRLRNPRRLIAGNRMSAMENAASTYRTCHDGAESRS